ncbi:MAG: class I SAM-dependent methyltransferase [Bdellovibrionota bacterium]
MQQSGSPYNLRFTDQPDYIVFNKRSGFRTHKVNENQLGLVEVLSSKIKQELLVVHRLDKETSGLIIFAKNKAAAAELAAQFESREVKKTYYLLTDQTLKKSDESITVKSHIDRVDKKFVNIPLKEDNSETKFTLSKKISDSLYLWKAEPITGRPHQIRLHAEKLGIPVLGDHEHGGSAWFRLALHAAEISFSFGGKIQKFSAPLPLCFENPVITLGDFVTSEYADLKALMTIEKDQTYRLYHRSNQEQEIRADLYGSIIWVYWYKKDSPTDLDLSSLAEFCKKHGLDYVVRHMINRGTGVGGKEQKDLYYSTAPEKWTAKEHTLLCELRRDQGFSPGLFLDQRDNRQFILENSKGKAVLNLFSYTSIFSVAAAVGGAKQITTVDASRAFLDWSKDNFKLNDLDTEKHEFFAQDSLLFLEGSLKRKRKWDIIICDPPSFGRTKTTTWKLDKDFAQLAKLMWECLNGKGLLLFTCNYEKWTLNDIQKQFEKALPKGQFKFQQLPTPDLDFEFPDAFNNLLKGIIVRKN